MRIDSRGKFSWLPVLVGAAAAVVLAVAAVTVPGEANYSSVNENFPGLPTAVTSSVLRLISYLTGAVTIGALVVGLAMIPARRSGRITPPAARAFGTAGSFGLLWALTACILIVVDAADTNGLSVARGISPEALMTMIGAANLPKAWILVTIGAGVVGFTAGAVRTWRAAVLLLVVAGLSVLPPVVTGHVAVAANHDWETDAAMFGSIAVAVWIGSAMVLSTRRSTRPLADPAALRFRRLSWWAFGIVGLTDLIVDVFELAGTNPLASVSGRIMIARMLVLVALGVLTAAPGAIGRRADTRSAGRRTAGPAAFMPAVWIMLGLGYFGLTAAMDRIPPPRYFASDVTIQKTLLGYTLPDPPTSLNLLLTWRVNILFLTIAVAGVAVYLWGVRRLRIRTTHAWPLHRTVSWIAGWASVVAVTTAGPGVYSPATFSMHMATHMVLGMISPLLLVLGAPITLTLASTSGRAGPFAGPREWITGCVNSPMMRVLANPAVVFVIYIVGYFGFYMTPAFTHLMIFHWGHQVVRLFFLVIGYLFFWLVVGADKPPKSLPALGKLAFVFAMMPFHAVFAIVIMSMRTIIGYTYFTYLDAKWRGGLKADQFAGGIIDWIGGEAPLVFVIAGLLLVWMRQDRQRTEFSPDTVSVLEGRR
ncbi:cytochrome c oxidase assembly protein [Spelaeicoccus albus]|uniref:Putative copper resistance protein D n=1 Tax=Spelaeicoccus albus TaxID=1280376 RepID=A0A7Z0D200_9MICO|nr:cytochrome c oxidase assembly protein [Spelaeicoccus albus]NYI67285.1 putative copper resistance protein D [Spelaeicoccus albus]